MFRLAIPILMMLMPRFLPRIIKYATLIWRLTRDKRVNIILRTLVPLALVYFILPTDFVKDQVPIIGRFDDIIVLGMALLVLVKLSPKYIVDEHMGVRPVSNRPEDQDPTNVVDGASRLIDE
ncbi:MAG: DUF1232 domain-containing protein [Chloroflexi bacterium]|nr:DUF1232 domain-containing protein [Chloroflexota bacterium]PKB57592.1 MAG: hypothetical protein BZY73_02475 [SAR202 cluster bacterium Casp-Chloro-G3]